MGLGEDSILEKEKKNVSSRLLKWIHERFLKKKKKILLLYLNNKSNKQLIFLIVMINFSISIWDPEKFILKNPK